MLKRWKEYFEKLMNEENNSDPRTEESEVVNEEVNCFSREVKNPLKRMKKGKTGPKKRFLDVAKEDIREVGARDTDVENRTVWRKMIRCGYP